MAEEEQVTQWHIPKEHLGWGYLPQTLCKDWRVKASAWPINHTQGHPTTTNERRGTRKGRTPGDIYYVGPKFYNRDKKQVTRLMPPFYNRSQWCHAPLPPTPRLLVNSERRSTLFVGCSWLCHGNLWCGGLQCPFEVGRCERRRRAKRLRMSIQMQFQCNQLSYQTEGRRTSRGESKWH